MELETVSETRDRLSFRALFLLGSMEHSLTKGAGKAGEACPLGFSSERHGTLTQPLE